MTSISTPLAGGLTGALPRRNRANVAVGRSCRAPPRHLGFGPAGKQRIARAGAALRPIDTRVYAERDGLPGPPSLEDRLRRLPEGHPSAPRHPADGRDRDDVRPLTDAEHAEHVADVKTRLADALALGVATHVEHTLDRRHEVWSYGRRLIHDDLVQTFYAKADGVPCEHKAIVAGGLPGAGKTTVLTAHAGIDRSAYLVVNPDAIKAELARRGLVPEVDGLTPMEASRLAHEESSHLAKRLAHRAQADGRNLIWDVTMSNAETCSGRIGALRSAGYAQVDAVFVDIPITVSLERADARHRDGHDHYRAGIGLGGRFLPRELILAQHDPAWGSVNRANFEQVKDRFSTWALYDNSAHGCPARLIGHSSWDRPSDKESR